MAAAAFPMMPVWRRTTPVSARCGSPTVRTRCIIAPLPDLKSGSIKTLRGTRKARAYATFSAVIPGHVKHCPGISRFRGRAFPAVPERRIRNLRESASVNDSVKKDEEFSGTREVEERHRVNEANLAKWMSEHVEGFAGPLTVLQFKGGQSNPTYRLNTPGRS